MPVTSLLLAFTLRNPDFPNYLGCRLPDTGISTARKVRNPSSEAG